MGRMVRVVWTTEVPAEETLTGTSDLVRLIVEREDGHLARYAFLSYRFTTVYYRLADLAADTLSELARWADDGGKAV
jgi:hypothetical protein